MSKKINYDNQDFYDNIIFWLAEKKDSRQQKIELLRREQNARRQKNDGAIEEEMPACRKIFNIFHPYDSVACRIEPLVCKEYVNKQPVFIPYHKGGKRIHIGMQEFGEDSNVMMWLSKAQL